MNNILLEARDISVAYGTNIVLEDINLILQEGEILSLVGTSGSGKSTFIHALLGLLPENGRVLKGDFLFRGKSLLKMKESKKRKIMGSEISMLFQHPGNYLNPTRTIGKQYRDFLLTHGIEKGKWKERAKQSLTEAGLSQGEEILTKIPTQLSGGMRQKVAFAMTLELKPRLILVDEPTAALDSVATYSLLQRLKKEAQEGSSVIIVTHDIRAAFYLSDKIIVLKQGKIVAHGTEEDIEKSAEGTYVNDLIRAVPKLY